MFPHVIQNSDKPGAEEEIHLNPAKKRDVNSINKDEQTLPDRKKGSPEATNFNNASTTRVICKNCQNEFEPQEAEMKVGEVTCPECNSRQKWETTLDDTGITAKIEWIKIRLENPDNFEKDSFRTIVMSESKGIKGIVGRPKGKTITKLQSVLFNKDKWTEEEAKKWAQDRQDTMQGYLQFLELEEAKVIGQPIDENEVIWREVNLLIAPYTETNYPSYLDKHSAGARNAWIKSFNNALKQNKGEAYAFKVAWSVLKRFENKHK
jgi:DNA-directed RNA polymerase subunit RPC12/RpoP